MNTDQALSKARRIARATFNRLRADELSHCHPSFAADRAIEHAAKVCGLIGHGVEGMADAPAGRHGITYWNTGDAYGHTLIYDSRSGRFYLGNWGAIVERNPNRFQ